MSFLVCGGAEVRCSMGLAISKLNITPDKNVLAGFPVACMQDNVVGKNILPFGMCTSLQNPQVAQATAAASGVLTPQPCQPVIAAPWSVPANKVFIGTVPAITQNSFLSCSYGGIIKLISPGQNTIMAD